MDGPLDNCRAGLKQSVEATTGLLLSHPFYGSLPYNASRNCFLTVVVPLGYRIRLKALDFDVQGQWGKCEHEDTFHIFDFNQPLDPSALDAVESSLPVGGDPTSPLLGRILGQYCGKTPKPKNDQSRHLVLAESSHNALILWWHTEEATKRKETAEEFAQQQKYQRERGGRHSTPMASSFAQQGYRLLWSSFRLMPDSQCQNGSKEFQCGGPPAQSSTPSPTRSAVECIPAPLGCNSYADCADASDLDPQLQLRHGCDHIPNDPLSLLTSSGPKRLLLCAALVLLWLSLCFGFCCFLVHFRRQRIKKKKRCPAGTAGSQQQQQQQELISRNGHPKYLNGRQQTSNGGGQFQLGERAPMPMVHQYSSSSGDRSATQMPPALPPPSFSPPAVPSNRPPPAPAAATIGGSGQMLNARQQQQQRQFQQHDQRQSASSSSHSSSQHQQQQQQKVPPPPPHLNSIGPNFGQQQQQQQRANGGGEYFYVHQPPAAGGGGAALLLKSDRHRQQQQPMPPESRRHLLL